MLIVLLLAVGAAAVTVDFYTSRGPDGSATGLNLNHALVADGADGDRNGPNDRFVSPFVYAGDGVPDGVQVGLLEYIYATPGAPYRQLARDAFDQNLQALVDWNGGVCLYPDGDGPGSTFENPLYGPLFAFADFEFCDLFGEGINFPVCFTKCTASHAMLLGLAAHITVSEYVAHANSKWHVLNYGQPGSGGYLVDFDADPAFNRAAAQVFGINGDINGDGLTNRDVYLSVARAVIEEYPALANATPSTLWSSLSRSGKDQFLGRYIQAAVYDSGPDPGDPEPPVFGIFAQSANTWAEAGPNNKLSLFVTTRYGLEPVAYQWHRNGVPLSDGPGVSGAQSAQLQIGPPLETVTSDFYFCTVEDALGQTAASRQIEVSVFETGALPLTGAALLGLLTAALAVVVLRQAKRL